MTRKRVSRDVRRWWAWIIRALVIVLMAAAVTEGLLRVGCGLGTPPLMQADPEVGYMLRADQDLVRFGKRVLINHYHQRSAAVAETPRENTLRILCLGDSVTWGGALTDQHDTFPEQLASLLQCGSKGAQVEVLNASAGSWGLGNEAAYLRRFGVFGSQWVVLQIGSRDLLQPKSNGALVGIASSMPDRNPATAISEAFNRYLFPRIIQYTRPSGPATPNSTDQEIQFRENMMWFGECVTLARAGGAQVVVVHTPDRNEVVAVKEQYANLYGPYRDRFITNCTTLKVPVADLIDQWRGRPETKSYFRDDVHPNDLGNRAIAEQVIELIK